MKHLLNLICVSAFQILSLIPVLSQQIYRTDIARQYPEILKGHLNLGGKNNCGGTIEVNSYYIERDGTPWYPVMGEFHYCRYPEQYWAEELFKMKAGGISVVSTYVFWSLHEKTEGKFDWSGNLNLRKFVELCKATGMEIIVRIGPFGHGEMRNGALPDWLYGRDFEVRANDSIYLDYARKLYLQIAAQLKGLLYADCGPVIGIQLENEYQHSAAPWALSYAGAEREYTVANIDRDNTKAGVSINTSGNYYAEYGQKHMQTLKKLAIEAGLIVPIYTATGWGYATIVDKGSIPVMSSYAFPFWEESQSLSNFYLYKNIQENPDYAPVSYDSRIYPYLGAELGTGMSVIYTRRPRVPGESFLPMMVRTVGSGANGLGFYMYHGGTTPSVGNFFYSEGFGLPNKSYDYQAPVREFGNPGTGFYGLKVINTFLKYYGSSLATLQTIIPETNRNIVPSDTSTLRYAVRSDGKRGFVFMHNYQDHIKTPDINNVKIKITSKDETFDFPVQGSFNLKMGCAAILPFNLPIGNMILKSATVQPLCYFENNGIQYHVFISFDGIKPEFVFKGRQPVSGGKTISVRNNENTIVTSSNNEFEFRSGNIRFLVIPFEKALDAYLTGPAGDQHLIISNALVSETGTGTCLISQGNNRVSISVYPKTPIETGKYKCITGAKHPFYAYFSIEKPRLQPGIQFKMKGDRRFVMNAMKMDWSELNDVYVRFNYRGDRGVCMLNGELATDNLYTSEPWTIGLKRYSTLLKKYPMYFYFLPMQKNAAYLGYLDKEVIPDFDGNSEFLEIAEPELIPEYKINLIVK